MSVIVVAQEIDTICVVPDDGELLGAKIRETLKNQMPVHLDFTGVRALTGPFLMTTFGAVYAVFAAALIESQLTWSGLDDVDERVARLVQQRVMWYYTLNDAQREALLQTTAEELIER